VSVQARRGPAQAVGFQMSANTERLGPMHVSTNPITGPRSDHAVGTPIRGFLSAPLKIEIHVYYFSAQILSILNRRIESRLRGGYDEFEDPPGARRIGDASRLALRLCGRAGDKPQGQAGPSGTDPSQSVSWASSSTCFHYGIGRLMTSRAGQGNRTSWLPVSKRTPATKSAQTISNQ
jgi:hypothetical protein